MASNVSTESEQDDNNIEVEINEENVDLDVVEDEEEGGDASEADVAVEDEATESEESTDEEAVEEDEDASVETEDAEGENAEDAEDATEGTFDTEEVKENDAEEADTEESTEAEVEEDDAEEEVEAEEELDLNNIYGTAKARSLEYDYNKGYYVLDLQAGLNNFSGNQVLTDKWVAFTLPNGVSIPNVDEVPQGIVQVGIDGKNAVAVKIPDVKEFPDSKYVYPEIPLIGEDQDNDPN